MDDEQTIQAPSADELHILQDVLTKLASLSTDARVRILETVTTYFRTPTSLQRTYGGHSIHGTRSDSANATISNRTDLSPKQFMLEKDPQTDVERVACLAYYLTHYRDTPHFNTLDISKVNTEAAQPKFSNAAYTVKNASTAGFLVAAPDGQKQISAFGEQFILALPDREKAKEVLNRRRRKAKRPSAKQDDGDQPSTATEESSDHASTAEEA